MILTPPRIIAIDDKPEHLTPIVTAFQDLGAPCLGLQYDPKRGLERRHFGGVRILVIDLNLMTSPIATDAVQQFSAIANILDSSIHKHGGPFVLVIWTEHNDRVAELIEYLDAPEVIRPFARPLYLVLDALDGPEPLQALSLPAYRLHRLHGKRAGEWSVRVSHGWRVRFRIDGEDVQAVCNENYHH